MSKPEVIVVGAGPGGLASAMLLANAGCRVTVLESQGRVGGRTSTLEHDGFKFDLGPTFFMYPRVLEEVFAACGRDLRAEVEMVRLDPQYHLIFGQGGEMRATSDLPRMEREIARLDPVDATRLRDYLADNRGKFAAFAPILQNPFRSRLDLLRPGVLKALSKVRLHKCVDGDLKRFFRDPRVRLAFSFQSKYLGMSPFRCPSLFTILGYMEYEYGVWHPIGGCGALTKAMAKACEEMGVKIRLGEPVEQLTFSGRTATGARTARGTHRADAVVVNGDFAHTIGRIVPDALRRRWTDRKIDAKQFSCSTFMMYLGVEGRFDHLEHHTIWLSEDYREGLKDIEERHVPSANPSFYVQNASRTDPTLAPPGHSALYCLAPVTNLTGDVDWRAEAPRFRALFYKQLAKVGLGDLERRVRFEKILTPLDWRESHGVYRGATFNLAHSLDQMLHKRPQNRFEDLDRVYLVGGGTHPGSGLPVIFESARISTRLLLKDLGVPASSAQLRCPPDGCHEDSPAFGAVAAMGRASGGATDGGW
ncbi:MAG TPA: phytoene desaturase family protein [Tepidisphaeraceae bacterium]|nr:phytoene desaturase family protein [Tepidisphaeraceae bacterium]